MARRTFTDTDVARILMRWHSGCPTTEVAHRAGVHPKTVRHYVAPAMRAGLLPGGPPLTEETWRANVVRWFPQLANPHLRQPTWNEIIPHHDRIGVLLELMPVSVIHRQLKDEVGLEASVSSLRRCVRANFDPPDRREAANGVTAGR